MAPELLLLALSVASYAAGALAALIFRGMVGRALVAVGALVGSLGTLALGAWCLATGATLAFAAPWLPLTGLALRADGLSAFFLVVVGLGGAAALVAAFLVLAGGDMTGSFAAMRSATLPPATRNVVFLLALVGFGTKAGVIPLHVWLPMAHPVAPSHVSALLSGVVIKMGVYGLMRVALDLLGGGPPWWGGVVLGLGAVSALLGVLYALMEHDLKRLLAYHSVENVGIILLGVGAGLMFQSYGLPGLATLGFIAGLYHTLNHACFKGLLFLGAGSVLYATHTRNMEELGGLIPRMPRPAACFLVGAAAISALPPLNGFASEWLVFQTLMGGALVPHPEAAIGMAIAVAASGWGTRAPPMSVWKTSHSDAKPLSGGSAEIAAAPTRKQAAGRGIRGIRPPSSSMFRVCVAYSTEPAPRNSRPLKHAWLSVW